MSIDASVDERTLREIYLASFEGAVKEAKPWSLRCLPVAVMEIKEQLRQ